MDIRRAIVFTGLIRDELKFVRFLDAYIAGEHAVDVPVYFSTWNGELQKNPSAAYRLNAAKAIVLQQQQPNLVLPGHLLHQVASWDLVLRELPDNVFVYKTRPDFADYTSFEQFMRYVPCKLAEASTAPYIPSYRFLVTGGFVAHPFYFSDITFGGLAADLKQLARITFVDQIRYFRAAPEQMVWTHLFVPRSPVLDLYFRVNVGLIFGNTDKTTRHVDWLKQSPLYCCALLEALEIKNNVFDFFQCPPEELIRSAVEGLPAEEILWGKRELPWAAHHSSSSTNILSAKQYISTLLLGHYAHSKFGDRLAVARGQIGTGLTDDLVVDAGAYAALSDAQLDIRGQKLLRADSGIWQMYSAAPPEWKQEQLGTPLTERLEDEVNQLRRRIDSLNREIASLQTLSNSK